MRLGRAGLVLAAVLALAAGAAQPDRDYLLFVLSEAADEVTLVRFGPAGARVERRVTIGELPHQIDGPHGIAVAPDGEHYYVSTAHGTPYGSLWKFATADDKVLGRVELGHYPASVSISPDGAFAYIVNFNLHGDMVPSSVSIVSTAAMLEVARPTTCTMPHGSRLSATGDRHYSVCMMDELAIEIDAASLGVARHFVLTRGNERGMPGAPTGGHAGHAMGGAPTPSAPPVAACSPTWAQPSSDGGGLFVACNRSNEIVELDLATWAVRRRLPAGEGVYNLAVTRDGRLLVATNKRGQSVSIFTLATGAETRIPTTRGVVHGVVISPDDRYAFVTAEGQSGEPGTVDVIDLGARRKVASVDVAPQASGIDFWRMEGR